MRFTSAPARRRYREHHQAARSQRAARHVDARWQSASRQRQSRHHDRPVDSAHRRPARRIELGKVVATAAFWLDASMGPTGELAFTGSEPEHPAELYYLPSPDPDAQRLTDYNREPPRSRLGRTETVRMGLRQISHGWSGDVSAGFRGHQEVSHLSYTSMAARVRHRNRPFPAARSCSPRKAGWCSSPTTAAATIWATNLRPASGTMPAQVPDATSWPASRCWKNAASSIPRAWRFPAGPTEAT